MAQTKDQKRLKALRYWEARYESLYIRKNHPKDLLYIHNQISCLTEKLKNSNECVHASCVLCGWGFIRREADQVICIQCKYTFRGIDMTITKMSLQFERIGIAATEAAYKMSSAISIFKLPS